MKLLFIVLILLLTSCLPAVTPMPIPTPTVKIIGELDFIPIFGIRGKDNITITFEVSSADALMTIAGANHVSISMIGEQETAVFWEEDVIDILIPPDTYKVVINDTDTWVILFGVVNKEDIPVIIIQDFERDQE